MPIGSRRKSRFERRSLARQRRVERRLDQAQSARNGRIRTGRGHSARSLSGKARLALFVASLLLGLGLARVVTARLVSWWTDSPAAVTAVAVEGTVRLTPAEVARSAGLSRGHPIDAFVPAQLAEDLTAHPWIRSARVAVLPTGTVILAVEERRPRAVLQRPGQPGIFVDAEGVAFAEVREQDHAEALRLPALAVLGDAMEGGSVEDGPVEAGASGADASAPAAIDLAEALGLLDRLEGMALPGLARDELPHRGLVLGLPAPGSPRGWVLRCAGGAVVVLGGGHTATVAERLDRLERLLSAGLGELDRTKEIDLRFAGQAVLRTEGTSG